MASPSETIRRSWSRLSPLPGGKWLFSRLLGFMNPYSGAVGGRVEVLEPGRAVVTLADRRGVRNHLDSVHAVALCNVAEMASGLAMLAALPPGARGIVTNISITYLKKARGLLTAESRITLPDVTVDGEHRFTSAVTDAAGDEVASAVVTWKLGPVPVRQEAAGGSGSEAAGGRRQT
jgi:acyl-coenzyme A thioesterase PaaI-like protein